jgi:phosphoribosylaminoimidazole-succinocarboxamide synthase
MICLEHAEIPELPNPHRGKVRDSFDLGDGRRVIVTTDRQSAFDRMLSPVPRKGEVLTRLSRFWFEATAELCPNHFIAQPDPNVTIVRSLKMIEVEVVVRGYLTGSTGTSIWQQYRAGVRDFGGIALADGLGKNSRLPDLIVTPTSKAPLGGHDLPMDEAGIVAAKLCTEAQWSAIKAASLAVFARAQEMASRRGLILVDTKYEFGLDEKGRIVLADEVHTPDSSRYWLAASYAERLAAGQEPEMLDKEYLRLWIIARCRPYEEPIPPIPPDVLAELSARYVRVCETLTGEKLAPPPAGIEPAARVRESLKKYLPQYFI